MNICIVSNLYPPEPLMGGIGIYVKNLAEGLVEQGHRVSVIARTMGEQREEEERLAQEQQAEEANQDLRAAIARVSQARAIARLTESQFYPTISLDPTASRTRFAEDRPVSPTVRPAASPVHP